MTDTIEPAPSARAKCRACRQAIAKGELRFGERVPNPYAEGETFFWYHVLCAALRLPQKLAGALDQGAQVSNRDELCKVTENALRHPKLPNVVRADRAPTGRARCQQCRAVIDKGSLRVVLERMDEGISSAAGFMHAACAARELGTSQLMERLNHVRTPLSGEDQALLHQHLDSQGNS